MSYPNIKPYPHQENTFDMSYQRHNQHYSVYRPAYHRIPSTPAIAPRQSGKEVWSSSMSPEVSPIVVPSMSAASLDFYQSSYYYYRPVVQSSNVRLLLYFLCAFLF